MISQAFVEWSENPVITTLESISSPISEIQFPTVTVCEELPPDNWALPEKILNLLAFQCSKLDFDCPNSTQIIREDFEFLIRSVVKGYWNLLNNFDIGTIIDAPNFKEYIKWHNDSGILDKVAILIDEGESQKFEDVAVRDN